MSVTESVVGALDAARSIEGEIVDLRRAIHRDPELGTDNPRTQARIVEALGGLGLEASTGRAITSVVADLVGGTGGPTILLRADTDALPMTEESGESFTSEHADRAHACGHDAHVAMLVGAARVLAGERERLAGRIRFMFQPGEEGFGGAATMIEEGVLDGVDAAFALHISPNVPTGLVAGRPGPLLASTDDFEIVVRGRGGHASTPHFGNDPIPVACEIVTAMQTFVTRRVEAFNPAVVTVGRIAAGTTTNVIPETATIAGTIRTVSDATRAGVVAGVRRVAEGIAAAHECTVDVRMTQGYPVTANHPQFHAFAVDVVNAVVGGQAFVELPSPVMGAEDFSYVLQRVPGAMAFLGACPAEIDDFLAAPSCHSNRMRLNESALGLGAALHVGVARAFLDAGGSFA
ncbi:MAG TPA: M20 family metallopeptidase [Microthrixaceae bacterium]|nr:M20 family metallopeptidase [Microthrixaceae bacterium]